MRDLTTAEWVSGSHRMFYIRVQSCVTHVIPPSRVAEGPYTFGGWYPTWIPHPTTYDYYLSQITRWYIPSGGLETHHPTDILRKLPRIYATEHLTYTQRALIGCLHVCKHPCEELLQGVDTPNGYLTPRDPDRTQHTTGSSMCLSRLPPPYSKTMTPRE